MQTAMPTAVQAAPAPLAQRRLNFRPEWLATAGAVLALGGIWDLYIRFTGISRFLLPSPLDVLTATWTLLGDPWFHGQIGITVYEVLSGFLLAIVLGGVIGVALGKSATVERLCNPLLIASQVMPKVALMPLFLLWLGFGMGSKIAMVTLLSIFPIIKNTILGVRSIERGHRDLFVVIRAGRLRRIVSLEIPAVLPYLMTAIETASVLAVTGAIVGEYLGGSDGLGAVIVSTMNAMKVDQMFATILVLTVLGLVFYLSIAALRARLTAWHSSTSEL